jgi:hypothetical protein
MHFREMVNNKHHFRFIVGCQPTFPPPCQTDGTFHLCPHTFCTLFFLVYTCISLFQCAAKHILFCAHTVNSLSVCAHTFNSLSFCTYIVNSLSFCTYSFNSLFLYFLFNSLSFCTYTFNSLPFCDHTTALYFFMIIRLAHFKSFF